MIRGIFFVFLLLPILGSSVQGAPARIALVIGNGDYEHAPLKNPVNDAALIAATLRGVGFEVFDYSNINRRELKRAFSRFGKRIAEAGRDTVSLVYYSGHGAQVRGENYLIPVGSIIEDELDVDIEGVRASSLLRTLEDAKAALNIVILDACRNNPFKSSSRSATRGLAKMDAPTGTLLAYSTAPGHLAEDGSGSNSAYTKALSLAIRTPGAKVEEVFKRVRIEVMTRTLDEQVPWESSSLTGDFYFVEGATSAKPATQIASAPAIVPVVEIEYWKSIATSNDVALYQVYLDRYPAGMFQGIAEQRMASLNAAEHSKTANNGTWIGSAAEGSGCEVGYFGLKIKIDGKKISGIADIAGYGGWPVFGSIDLDGKLKARINGGEATIDISGIAKDSVMTGKWDASEHHCAGKFSAKLTKK